MPEQQYNPQINGAPFPTSDVATREHLHDEALERAKVMRIEGVPAELVQRDNVGELYVSQDLVVRAGWAYIYLQILDAVNAGRVIRVDPSMSLTDQQRADRCIARFSAEYHERLAAEARNTLKALGG